MVRLIPVTRCVEIIGKTYTLVEQYSKIITCLWSMMLFVVFVIYNSEPGERYEYVQKLGVSFYNNAYVSILGPTGTSIVGIEMIKKCLFNLLDAVKKLIKKYDYEYVAVIREYKTLTPTDDKSLLHMFADLDGLYSIFRRHEYDVNKSKYVLEFMKLTTKLIKIENNYCRTKTTVPSSTVVPASTASQQFVHSPQLSDMVNKLDAFVKSYGMCGKRLELKVINPIISSMIEPDNYNGPPLSSIFLVGAPGVGKTHFVNTLVDIIGAKLYVCDKHIVGTLDPDSRHISYSQPISNQYHKFNMFLKIIIENDNSNKPIIVFIDEIDKIGNKLDDTLLKLLGESSKRYMYFPCLGNIKLTIPNKLLVICASNISMEQMSKNNKNFFPLISRFEEINITLEQKFQIEYSLCYLRTNLKNTTPEDEEYIKLIINKKKYTGLREIINIINQYINHNNALKQLSMYKHVRSKTEYIKNNLMTLSISDSD